MYVSYTVLFTKAHYIKLMLVTSRTQQVLVLICSKSKINSPSRRLSEVFSERRRRLEHVCYSLLTQDYVFSTLLHRNMKRIYALTEAKVAWCPIFKAGSTTIIRSLHEMWNNTKVSLSSGPMELSN